MNFKEEINLLVQSLNSEGKAFIENFLDQLNAAQLTEEEEIEILDFAIKTIYADEKTEYSEVKFFKTIRHRLEITDDDIRKVFTELDDNFIKEDIKTASFLEKITHQFLEDIKLPTFDRIKFKEDEK